MHLSRNGCSNELKRKEEIGKEKNKEKEKRKENRNFECNFK